MWTILAVGREAAHAFRQAGLRHMACLGNGQPYSEQRIQGFRQAADSDSAVTVHNERGFEDTRYSESFLRPSAALGQWLRDLPKPIGIFAVHDPLGRYLCGACQQLGLGVPDDVSVIGANNDELVCGFDASQALQRRNSMERHRRDRGRLHAGLDHGRVAISAETAAGATQRRGPAPFGKSLFRG